MIIIPMYLNALNNFKRIGFSVMFANAPKAK